MLQITDCGGVLTDAVKQHQRFYGNDNSNDEADDRSVGSAAAMQALKMFSGGGSGNSQVTFCRTMSMSDHGNVANTKSSSRATARVLSLVLRWRRQAR